MRIITIIIGLFALSSLPVKADINEIHLATVNWPPFLSETLPEQGILTAISKEAFKDAGITLKVSFVPWKRALENAKRGKYDGLLGAYKTDERLEYFHYTERLFDSEEGFIKRKGHHFRYQSLDDLKHFDIIVMRGTAPSDDLKALGFNVIDVAYQSDGLKVLAGGRPALLSMGRLQFLYFTDQGTDLHHLRDKLEVVTPIFKSYGLYNTLYRHHPQAAEIIRKFNQSLAKMHQDGRFDAIVKRLSNH